MLPITKAGMSQTVLVTGSSGTVGSAVVAELQRRGHTLRGFDKVPAIEPRDMTCAALLDRRALNIAMTGVDCLVHLAATPEDDDFFTQLVPNNIAALYCVMESARGAGVRRIVLASSSQVNWWRQMRGPFPIREDEPVTPRGWYAASKMFAEAIGCAFAEAHGISVIAARLGWCPRPNQEREFGEAEWAPDVYLSPGYAGRFFACCVEAPESVRHLTVNATSKPVGTARFDLTVAKEVLGYEPQDTWIAKIW